MKPGGIPRLRGGGNWAAANIARGQGARRRQLGIRTRHGPRGARTGRCGAATCLDCVRARRTEDDQSRIPRSSDAARSPAMTALKAGVDRPVSGGRSDAGSESGRRGRRSPRAGKASGSPASCSASREYVAVLRMALAREPVEFHGETIEMPTARLTRQGTEKADDRFRPGGRSRSTCRDSARSEEHVIAGRIAAAGSPPRFSPEHVLSSFCSCSRRAPARGAHARRLSEIAPVVNRTFRGYEYAAIGCAGESRGTSGGHGSRSRTSKKTSQRYTRSRRGEESGPVQEGAQKDEAAAPVRTRSSDTVTSVRAPRGAFRDRLAAYRGTEGRRQADGRCDGVARRSASAAHGRGRAVAGGRG